MSDSANIVGMSIHATGLVFPLLAGLACVAAVALQLSGCLPGVKVSEQTVVPETWLEPVLSDWDPTIGPDVAMGLAYKFKEAMSEQSDKIEVVEPDDVWRWPIPGVSPEARRN